MSDSQNRDPSRSQVPLPGTAEATVTVPLALLVRAEYALKRHSVTWVALSGLLDKPYADNPETTPYDRFARRAIERGEGVRKELKEAIGRA